METMCKLTTLCVQNIYYYRKILPEHFFTSQNIDGVNVKKFKARNDTAIVNANRWISGTLDALRKEYVSIEMS